MFSVVIPLYNKAAYIEFTLNSVLEQVQAPLEIIVVDDGSTDRGPRIVQNFATQNVCIRLVKQSNAGVAAARNKGVAEARGEWVAFLDADDWWHPDYLSMQHRAVQVHPDVDVVAAMLRRIPDAPDWSPLPWPPQDPQPPVVLIDDLPHRWMQGIPFFTSSVAVRRTRLLAMQPCFAVGESHGEDLDLWFRLAEHSAIAHTQAALVAYRTAAMGSLMSQHAQRSMAPYLLRMERRARSNAMPVPKQAAALRFVAQQRVTLAREALIGGDRWEALQWLWRGRYAAGTKRWCMSLLMVGALPSTLVQRWERWRNGRTSVA